MLESNNILSDEQKLEMRNLCKEFKALPQASTPAFRSKFRVEECASDEDEVSAASDNEIILECEKELLVTTLH